MKRAGLTLAALVAGACQSGGEYAQAVCALVDTSGTYADQSGEVVKILKSGVLPSLVPGDSLVVARIDSDSYGNDNVLATATLDPRPSRANAQKLALGERIDALRSARRSRYTDIQGGMMLCSERLAETGAGDRVVLIFSDLREELPPRAQRALEKGELDGARVAALQVKKLERDNADPAIFRKRVVQWRERLSSAGAAGFEVLGAAEKVTEFLGARP
jgi:hypothetical protein